MSGGLYGSSNSGNKDIIVGKIEDIKASPSPGERRVVVREKGGRRATLAVDMPTRCSKDLERKETYAFAVEEKDAKNFAGTSQRLKAASRFKSYHCDDAPEKYTGIGGWGQATNRFGSEEAPVNRRTRKFHS